jgi:phosphatidylserine/phosphatidylglycerophosphate/cardiolipin synthase-like enzyme
VIEISDGWAVERLIRRVVCRPEQYRRLWVCAPFIDARWRAMLMSLALRDSARGCELVLVTTPLEVKRMLRHGPLPSGLTVNSQRGLHSKVYLLEGEHAEDCEVIVTSANLTDRGLRENKELGTRATPTSPAGRLLYYDTVRQMRCAGYVTAGLGRPK